MSHGAQRAFVQKIAEAVPDLFSSRCVLEIGSLDINGSVRQFFDDCDYIGVDLEPGPGVDVVSEGQKYDAQDASFDVVISCECMEHNPYWKETFANMVRACRPGGLAIMTCATVGRPEHGTARSDPKASPFTIANGWNYYANISEKQWNAAFPLGKWFLRSATWTNWESSDLYFVGLKAPAADNADLLGTWDSIEQRASAYVSGVNDRPRLRLRSAFGRGFGDAGFHAVRRAKKLFGVQ